VVFQRESKHSTQAELARGLQLKLLLLLLLLLTQARGRSMMLLQGVKGGTDVVDRLQCRLQCQFEDQVGM
jgi:hypothetical protein